MKRVMAASLALFLLPAAAISADGPAPSRAATAAPLLSEARLGAFLHDPFSPEKGSVDLNGEVLLAPFGWDRVSRWGWLAPRIHFGGTANFAGRTSAAYAGFTWTLDINNRLFVEGALGGAVHSGATGPAAEPDRNAMGCKLAFHEAASLGYRFSHAWSVMATVEHYSNAGLCSRNRGLTNMGVRVAYTF